MRAKIKHPQTKTSIQLVNGRTMLVLTICLGFLSIPIHAEDERGSIKITETLGNFVSFRVVIPPDADRARVTQSTDLKNWQISHALAPPATDWLEKPQGGWAGEVQRTLSGSGKTFFLRLEVEFPEPLDTSEFVVVGDPANRADAARGWDGSSGYGRVPYVFRIGRYEVTYEQHVEFLNAVAKTDPNGLYKHVWGDHELIVRTGNSGDYRYTVEPARARLPVSSITFYDAARYCNWRHNGKPSGPQNASTTEDGAYTMTAPFDLVWPGTDPFHGDYGRNFGARFFVPGEDEWYKAAYYDPTKDGKGGYWLFATRSDQRPTTSIVDEFGFITNDTDNIAHYDPVFDPVPCNLDCVAVVGSGGRGSISYYGAHDMSGNVREIVDRITHDDNTFGYRTRGGGFGTSAEGISSHRFHDFRAGGPPLTPDGQDNFAHGTTYGTGFRIAAPAP